MEALFGENVSDDPIVSSGTAIPIQHEGVSRSALCIRCHIHFCSGAEACTTESGKPCCVHKIVSGNESGTCVAGDGMVSPWIKKSVAAFEGSGSFRAFTCRAGEVSKPELQTHREISGEHLQPEGFVRDHVQPTPGVTCLWITTSDSQLAEEVSD